MIHRAHKGEVFEITYKTTKKIWKKKKNMGIIGIALKGFTKSIDLSVLNFNKIVRYMLIPSVAVFLGMDQLICAYYHPW